MGRKEQSSAHIPIVDYVFEPLTQEERVRNQGIAKRIKDLFQKCGLSSSTTSLQFMNPHIARKDPDYTFIIFSLEEQGKSRLPENISYPLYGLALNNQARRFKNDDGKIYHAEVRYLFNDEGQGIQTLVFKKDSSKIYTAAIAGNYPLLSVPAKLINTPKFSTVKGEDFPRIETLITRAESEKWSKPEVVKPYTVIIAKQV